MWRLCPGMTTQALVWLWAAGHCFILDHDWGFGQRHTEYELRRAPSRHHPKPSWLPSTAWLGIPSWAHKRLLNPTGKDEAKRTFTGGSWTLVSGTQGPTLFLGLSHLLCPSALGKPQPPSTEVKKGACGIKINDVQGYPWPYSEFKPRDPIWRGEE